MLDQTINELNGYYRKRRTGIDRNMQSHSSKTKLRFSFKSPMRMGTFLHYLVLHRRYSRRRKPLWSLPRITQKGESFHHWEMSSRDMQSIPLYRTLFCAGYLFRIMFRTDLIKPLNQFPHVLWQIFRNHILNDPCRNPIEGSRNATSHASNRVTVPS